MKLHKFAVLIFLLTALFSFPSFASSNSVTKNNSPNDGDWQQLNPANAPDARFGHSLVTMPDGRGILSGGKDSLGELFDDLHIFEQNQWSEVTPLGDSPSVRSDHSAWVHGDNMLIFGGTNETSLLNDLWSYSPDANQWSPIVPNNDPPAARYGAKSWVYGNQLYMMGGKDENGLYFGEVFVFNPDTGEWETKISQINAFPVSRVNAVGVYGDSAYVLASFDEYLVTYDLSKNTMAGGYPNGTIPEPRLDSAFAQSENTAWIFGGKDDSTVLSDAYAFDFATETYTRLPDMPFPLHHAAASFNGKEVVVYGGVKADDSLNDTTLLYTPNKGWEQQKPADSPEPRFGHSLTAAQDQNVYLFGGEGSNNQLAPPEIFMMIDSTNGKVTWVQTAPPAGTPASSRADHSAWGKQGQIWIYGGKKGVIVLDTFFKYDPVSNEWNSVDSNNTPPSLYGQTGYSDDDHHYQIGGTDGQGVSNKVYEFDANTGEWAEKNESLPFPISHGASAILPADQSSTTQANQALAGTNEILIFLGVLNDRTLSYNPATDTWSAFFPPDQATNPPYGTIPPARQYAAYAQSDTKVWLFGGKSGSTVLDDVWEFDLATKTFTQLDDMPFPLYGAAAAFNGKRVVIFGGKKVDDTINGLTLLYTPDGIAQNFKAYLPLITR